MREFIRDHYIILHTLLIPVFFIVHNWFDFYLLADFSQIKMEVVLWLLLPLLLAVCFYLIFRSYFKASLFTSLLLLLFFFGPSFMAFADGTTLLFFLGKLSFFYISAVIILSYIFKKLYRSKKNYLSIHRFLFFCFLILLIYEPVYWFAGGKQKVINKNRIELSKDIILENKPLFKDSLPDIYFLVFDELAATDAYQQILNYDNTENDSTLRAMGFKIISNAFSASHHTHVALPAVFNMSYLPFRERQKISFREMHALVQSVNENPLIPFLQANGYKINNGSIFNLQNIQGLTKPQTWGLHSANEMITSQTLTTYTWNSLGWIIKSKIPGTVSAGDKLVSDTALINEAYSILQNTIADTGVERKFLYAHFLLPHAPVRYDSTGKVLHWANGYEYLKKNKTPLLYTGQVKYTFNWIIKMCRQIQEQSKRPVLIIVQGDHGLRDFDTSKLNETLKLRPYTAFYFFDRNYDKINDTFYTPNTFRLVLNQYFKQQVPLLEKKLYYLQRDNEASLFKH